MPVKCEILVGTWLHVGLCCIIKLHKLWEVEGMTEDDDITSEIIPFICTRLNPEKLKKDQFSECIFTHLVLNEMILFSYFRRLPVCQQKILGTASRF